MQPGAYSSEAFEEGSDHFGFNVRIIFLHFCKRPGLEPMTSWTITLEKCQKNKVVA
jgi:hypothetical protein